VTFLHQPQTESGHTAESVLAGLDAQQREAVTAPVGIVVVRAGAGSGKTTVLTRRIAWRTLSGTADIEKTLAITFTRQAATEMRTRLARFDLEGRPTIGTFHAIARRLMLQNLEDRNRRAPVIVNNRSSLMSSCMGDDAKHGGVMDMLSAIDWAHAHMIAPDAAASALSSAGMKIPLPALRFTEVFKAYEQTKRKRGVIDLNDFMTSVVNEAARDPRFAESIRFQYRHVSVDEAQDMNPLQYAFLKVLLPASPDVFLVGDPNQAIYGFNGADKDLFDSLPGFSTGANVVSLPSNYRCTPEIVKIAVDSLAKDGQIADAVSQRPSGAVVRLERCATEAAEQQLITKLVTRAHSSDRSWSDIAVLVRVNTVADGIRDQLIAAGIPVRSSRRGGAWARAVAAATSLTGRDDLATWAADILDTGEYTPDDADFQIAKLVRDFLDLHRSGGVDGRTFGSWLVTSADIAETDGVEVLTFHAAKGREWSYVIVAGMEKGLLPHRSARTGAARSEEARLAYVALTRAADELVVTWTDQRNTKSSGPSPFLPSVTTSVPVVDAPPEELRRIARQRPQQDPLEVALEEWRQQKARIGRMEPNGILTTTQMRNIVRDKPTTEEAIAGLTDIIFARRYATELTAVIDSALGR
jgi:DNA helicase-2/ATP-dependent DNA helicase PcrA